MTPQTIVPKSFQERGILQESHLQLDKNLCLILWWSMSNNTLLEATLLCTLAGLREEFGPTFNLDAYKQLLSYWGYFSRVDISNLFTILLLKVHFRKEAEFVLSNEKEKSKSLG